MIEANDLTKRFGRCTAVDGLSFQVQPGRVTGFLGPNGAGKSTTMRMMLGLDRPTSGTVSIDGVPYQRLSDPLRTVGALLDARAVHPRRTALNHLRILARSNGIPARRVREVIELTGLSSVAHRQARTFSLGMSQRLGIAAALLGDPAILVLDEPVNGLDPEGVLWIRKLMRDLATQGRTVFVSSHLMSEVALSVDHLIIIGRGRLLADTSMTAFIDQQSDAGVQVRTPEPQRLHDVLAGAGITVTACADGSLQVAAEAERIGVLAAAHAVTVHEVRRNTASLEEAFMRLTADTVVYRAEQSRGTHR
ncbi:ABC transporter ATP-binding protein [Streptomyces albipurpureus]|uniref:ABC transporter ATP-binding protein n=1 Tax=Streptomyces albipurpureus TaxID=2897419 RepID=A0ABT0UQ30_9ACTN|nr:ABC transporter ATP-binding protein [Streptomyces sp. CWNU-1]MCM2389468.1 ABC transporter ATP-binding protein [Streptomyces sp. CWNU-1]